MSAARAIALAVLLGFWACRDALTPSQSGPRHGAIAVIPGQYIVVFRDTVADPVGLAQSLVNAQSGTLLHSYTSALQGFAARLSDAAVAALRQNALIAYVEPDRAGRVPSTWLMAASRGRQRLGPMGPLPSAGAGAVAPDRAARMSVTQQMDANGDPWGLDRIDQRALPLSGMYTYTSTGAGVHVYILDSGIWTAHPEFEQRADIVYDYAGGNGQDCFGHGTLVAGVVGAATYGVAKGVFLHGVRVWAADCQGSLTVSEVIAGIDWVTAHHQSPAVANLPTFGLPTTSTAFVTAIQKLWDSGVFVATTANNGNEDACQEASGQTPFAVAASTRADTKASFSNWGQCVKIYAPGEDIKSTWPGGGTSTQSGTSFAAPHVAGVAALYKGTFGDTSSGVVANWILSNATAGVITGNPPGTPNLLLYSPAGPLPPPVATFTFGCSGLSCSFDASSSQAQTSATYGWSWGDGGTGTGKTATYSYAAAGTYSVTLTVTDAGGSNSQTQSVTVSSAPPPSPVATFTFGCSGLSCSFDASSSQAQTSATYNWGWGDGASGTGQTATHTYAAGGTYSVTLAVTDGGGSSTQTQSVTVVAPPGNLTVTASTTGLSLSLNGYTITVDGTAIQQIPANGSVAFTGLVAGSHSVSLSGASVNCSVSSANPQTVTVPSGGTATSTFAVSCVP
jgi:PKD repeat protein